MDFFVFLQNFWLFKWVIVFIFGIFIVCASKEVALKRFFKDRVIILVGIFAIIDGEDGLYFFLNFFIREIMVVDRNFIKVLYDFFFGKKFNKVFMCDSFIASIDSNVWERF